MFTMVSQNRAIYDILVLLLSYPEKRASLLDNVIQMNVDEESSSSTPSDSEFKESYNVCCNVECSVDFAFGASTTHRFAASFASNSIDDCRYFVANHTPIHP